MAGPSSSNRTQRKGDSGPVKPDQFSMLFPIDFVLKGLLYIVWCSMDDPIEASSLKLVASMKEDYFTYFQSD